MYAGVPSAMPAVVRLCGRVASLTALATPKSVTSGVPAGEHHVLGLDVAVHDAARVRVRQGVGDVARGCLTASGIGSSPRALQPLAQ